ncbi:HAD-IA family hydrolase [Segatella baroniae]|nr:HAD-IA family hydrolase [Segatella baroniae]
MIKQAFMDLHVPIWKQLWYHRRIKRLMDEYINGIRPTDEVMQEMLALCGKRVSMAQLQGVVNMLAGELPKERLLKIRKLRKKYKVFVLSNINETLWRTCVRQIEELGMHVEDCFDDVFLSYAMHVAKPDADIYRQMILSTGIQPEETLYLDDRVENVEAGKKMGLIAELVVSNQLEQNKAWKQL